MTSGMICIRNDFAHQVTTTFDIPAVVSRCGQLRTKAPDYPGVTVGSAGQFETAAMAIIVSPINRPHHVAKERRASRPWPS
jgi:mannitol operon repressor